MKRAWLLYKEGFLNMPKWGRTMWIIMLVKGFIMFAILRAIFFPNFLSSNFDNDESRSDYVIEQITNQK
ncbi:MAG: DUF4492 domain-containing protein [Bacteroidales bacterium]